jgi:hypothetical protein
MCEKQRKAALESRDNSRKLQELDIDVAQATWVKLQQTSQREDDVLRQHLM